MNLIYQYWDGEITGAVKAGSKAMKEYADVIGVDYLFEDNPRTYKNFGKYSPHYGQFKILKHSKFEKYDNIMFADTDVFPVYGLDKNVFDKFTGDVSVAEEPFQPAWRFENKNHHIGHYADEKWADIVTKRFKTKLRRTPEGLMKIYNSGVVLYSRKGIDSINKYFEDPATYYNVIAGTGLSPFYRCDQPYLHAMMLREEIEFQELHSKWNTFVHYYGNDKPRKINDERTCKTCFVHIQLSNADSYDEQTLWRITNLEQYDWKL